MKTKVESFEDIVFENRNKEYGAYELRKRYSKRGSIALIMAFCIMFFAVGGPLVASIMKQRIIHNYVEKNAVIDLVSMSEDKDMDVPPPPPPPPAPSVKEIKFVAPIVVDSVEESKNEFEINDDVLRQSNSPILDTSAKIKEVVVIEKIDIVDEKPIEYVNIKEKPIFPGGDKALLKYIAENTVYPEQAIQTESEGTVYVRFVVTKTGKIGDVLIMRPVDPALDEEAMRVIKTLPQWTPGKNDGRPVNVWFIVPVRFALQKGM